MRRDAREVWLQMTAVDIKILEMFDYLERVGGSIYPSQRWLAGKLRVSERTVRRGIAHLKALGVILVRARHCRDRRGQIHSHSNVYKILGLAGAFIRGLLARLSGRPGKTRGTTAKQKTELLEFRQEEKGELSPEIRRKIPLLEKWMGRGEAFT